MRGHRDSRARQRETTTANNGHASRRHCTLRCKTIEGRCLHHTDKAENDGENHDANEDDVDIHVLLTH